MEQEVDSGFLWNSIEAQISPLPKPPTSKEPDHFDERADEFLESLPRLGEEINAFIEKTNEFSNSFYPMVSEMGKEILNECNSEAQKLSTEIHKIKEDAKKEIQSQIIASNGRLKEAVMRAYLLALSVREVVRRNRENYERVGEVREFRGGRTPRGYVRLPAVLKSAEYPLLKKALNAGGEEFKVLGAKTKIIYTGKGD